MRAGLPKSPVRRDSMKGVSRANWSILIADTGAAGGTLLAQVCRIALYRGGLEPILAASDSVTQGPSRLKRLEPSSMPALFPAPHLDLLGRPSTIARYDFIAELLARPNTIIRLGREVTLGFLLWARRTRPALAVNERVQIATTVGASRESRLQASVFLDEIFDLGHRLRREPKVGLVHNTMRGSQGPAPPVASDGEDFDPLDLAYYDDERHVHATMPYLALLERPDVRGRPLYELVTLNNPQIHGPNGILNYEEWCAIREWVRETIESLRRSGLVPPPGVPLELLPPKSKFG